MILRMSVAAFTMLHVIISLVAIVAGLAAVVAKAPAFAAAQGATLLVFIVLGYLATRACRPGLTPAGAAPGMA
jgi:hypothetical protein